MVLSSVPGRVRAAHRWHRAHSVRSAALRFGNFWKFPFGVRLSPATVGSASARSSVIRVGCCAGKPVDTADKQHHLLYNEFIVYDTQQVLSKFLLKVKFHYK
jgi:hypothetical protein